MLAKRRVLISILLSIFILAPVYFSSPVSARMVATRTERPSFSKLTGIAALPNLEQCTHKTGRLWFTVSNYGILGNQRNPFIRDCLTGGAASSAEYPGGSGVEYLFQGALWVGGIVGRDTVYQDTMTSIGNDGWRNIREFFPEAGTKGSILHRSANPASPYYSPEAISDLDLIATYYDTLKDVQIVTTPDPEDGRPHRPLGLKIVQKSHSWTAEWGQDFLLLDYIITNIGQERIRQVQAGLLIDPDIGNTNGGRATHTDDYAAFLKRFVFDTCRTNVENLNIAYAYDNDGDSAIGEETGLSLRKPTGALGVRILRAGEPLRPDGTLNANLSFNWWVPDSLALLDWGPQKRPGRTNFFGRRGQPMGDRMRYYYLSNREIDYDQVASALGNPYQIDTSFGSDWLPPLAQTSDAIEIANGADVRFLLSAGPFDLEAEDSLVFTFTVFAGPAIHTDFSSFYANFPSPADFLDPVKVAAYRKDLELFGLLENARMARKIFDNDTESSNDICGVRCYFNMYLRWVCDTLYKARPHGDGIPDFKGPTPPPYPKVEFATDEGEVTIRWFGRETENAADPISGLKDFEGYRILMSPNGVDWTIVGSFDKMNWKPYFLNTRQIDTLRTLGTWQPAFTRLLNWEEIQRLYAVRWDTCRNKIDPVSGMLALGHPIDPDRFKGPTQVRLSGNWPQFHGYCNPDTLDGGPPGIGLPLTAIRVRFCNSCSEGGLPVDTMFYFVRQDFNLGLDKVRMYPNATDPANDSAYWYEFKMTGLLPSQPVWFSVVPFDYGWVTPNLKIDPQAGTPYANRYLVYPIASDSIRRGEGLKISVYPNPYRIDHDYSFFEKKQPITGHPQSSKRVNFINLPPKCTIRIYTLDGDLVQQINHDKDPRATDAGWEFWDLLSRNAQFVAAGLYLFTVESAEGRYVGKLIIIQ
jgi:hypothetical protein